MNQGHSDLTSSAIVGFRRSFFVVGGVCELSGLLSSSSSFSLTRFEPAFNHHTYTHSQFICIALQIFYSVCSLYYWMGLGHGSAHLFQSKRRMQMVALPPYWSLHPEWLPAAG